MSQHYFDAQINGDRVTVTLGWDRPLGHFFMTIEKEAQPEAARTDDDDGTGCGKIIYSNLDERQAFALDLRHFENVLSSLGITVPPTMFSEVALDKELRVGNRHVRHRADGSFSERAPAAATRKAI